MAYIGNELQVAYSSYTNIDDISASFNGVTTSFTLLVKGVAPVPFPINSQQCLISVGGVLQQPDDSGASGFRLSGNNIVFSSAPATGEDFFGVILAGADYVNVGANFPDGSAAAPSITFDQDTDTGFYRAGPGSVALSSNGTPVITVDTSRRVGIGTSSLSPTYEQTINGDGSSIVGGLSLRNNNTETLTIGNVTATNNVDSEIWNPQNGYLRFATNNTERLRIDSSGRVLVGTSTSRNVAGITGNFYIESTGDGATASIVRNSNNNAPPFLLFGKSRGSSNGSNAVVANNDYLGAIDFAGADGSGMAPYGAEIAAVVDGTPGTNVMPGRLQFSTTASGAGTPTERMRIAQNGVITAQGVYDFTTANAANVAVLSAGQIYRSTSSSKYKTDIETLQDQYADALLNCRPVWYRSTCESDCPQHSWWGFIAEEVAEIDPRLVHWKTTKPVQQENGSLEHVPCEPEPEGVAYDRFVPHLLNLIKRQQQAIETLEAKVAALEA